MPIAGFYYTYGNDADMIEKKWLPDVKRKYPNSEWFRYDASIDDIRIGKLVTEYNVNDLFSSGKVIVIRNGDAKPNQIYELAEELTTNPTEGSALVILASGWNKTTKLGKLVKKHFIVREFNKIEIKPWDLLDSLSSKNTAMVLKQSARLFDANYNELAMFSLIFGHFLLLRQVSERRAMSPEAIAREIKQHVFRVKKANIAMRYWHKEELDEALQLLSRTDALLRSWQYDPKMILQMSLINLCL